MANNIKFISSIHNIGALNWNSLLSSDNPFLRFEFLSALEDCQCINSANTPQTLNSGWIPHYALLEDEQQKPLAIAPIYQKRHSYGEYVFDWAWADAYERYGLNYYPKLVWAIPFTPSTGPRIISQGNNDQLLAYYQDIALALSQHCLEHDFSSWHCLFPDLLATRALTSAPTTSTRNPPFTSQAGMSLTSDTSMLRTSCQFHWFNEGFKDFSHYLEKFTSRKRKNIKKERARLQESGFVFQQKTESEISEEDIEIFYHCYQLTYAKRQRYGYLTLNFFKQLLKTMPEQMLLIQAQRCGKNVANALYFKDADNLYGRFWGCLEEFDSLHFECCYYQGIDYCIENNLSHFDPGTQGEHKISRGFEATTCYSLHWIAHPQFREAIDHFIKEEQLAVEDYATAVKEHSPFKNSE